MKKPVNKNIPKQNTTNNEPTLPEITPNTATQSGYGAVFTDALLSKLFYGSLIGMLIFVWFTGFGVGFHGDEIDMNNYGKANIAFYASGGKDTCCTKGSIHKPAEDTSSADYLLRYYGCAFEYVAVGANKILGTDKGVHEFDVRHIASQAFGIFIFLFAGLIARKLSGWRTALFTIWILYLSPCFFGHLYINTKDIPFCAGYMASLYFIINFLEELPNPTWKTATWVMLAFAFTTNSRIGGVLLIVYLFLFAGIYLFANKELLAECKKNAVPVLLKFAYIPVVGMVLVVLTWPYVLLKPIAHLQEAMATVSKFPLKVNINFEGGCIDSMNIPPHYLPKFMMITIPIIVMLLVLTGIVFLILRRKTLDWKLVALLLFSTLFPPIYAVVKNVALYSGWRHFLFIYPGLCILAAIGLNELLVEAKRPAIQLAIGLLCLIGFAKPVLFSIQNHPYAYCYFNELGGGFKTAYYNYDNDYWMISMKKSMDWLVAHEPIANSKDTITIASNQRCFVKYYLQRHCPNAKVKIIPSGVTGRNSLYWTYAVYSNFFVKPDYLENFYPPAQTVYTESIEGLTICAVVKDLNRYDYLAQEALKATKHAVADSLYTLHIKTSKDHNPGIDGNISVAKASLNQVDDAIAAGKRALQYHLSQVIDYNAQCGLGIAYANKGQLDLSISTLQEAMKTMPKEHFANDILVQVYNLKKMNGGNGVQPAQQAPPPAQTAPPKF